MTAAVPKLTGLSRAPLDIGDRFERVRGNGRAAHLVVTTAGSPVRLMRELSRDWEPPFVLLYVLTVPRSKDLQGRCQSPWLDRREDVETFFNRFANLLEGDGRHDLWLAAPESGRQIVYDRHERLFVEGAVAETASALEARGYAEGLPPLPVPHEHHYHREFDGDFAELMASWSWRRSPLQPGDEY